MEEKAGSVQQPVIHPCQKCGACCAVYRVSFHWSETLEGSFEVPQDLTVKVAPYMSAMKSVNFKTKRCVALDGNIGKSVGCGIYENRPSPCRNFQASYEGGIHNQRCDEARQTMGLSPLTLEDYSSNESDANLRVTAQSFLADID